MYAPRAAVPESPAENTGEDEVVIVRRSPRARRERVAPAAEGPQRESLASRIVKAPVRAAGRFLGRAARNPLSTVGTILGTTTLLSIGHHTGFNQMVVGAVTSPGPLRDALNTPGRWSHQMWSNIGGRLGERLPSVVTTPAGWLLDGTRDLMGPPPGR